MSLPLTILPQRGAWGDPSGIINTAYTTGLIGAWRFGRPTGATDVQARQLCAINKAPLGARGFSRCAVVGAPIVNDDYFTFQNGQFFSPLPGYPASRPLGCIMTDIVEPSSWAAIALCRSQDTNINVGDVPSCALFGWYSSNDGQGSVSIVYSSSAYRQVSFDMAADPITHLPTITAEFASVTIPSNTQSTWRIIYFDASQTELKVQNLTGDSPAGINEPTPFTLTGGRLPAHRPMLIGSAYQGYVNGRVDIRELRLYATTVPLDAGVRAGIAAEIRDGLTGSSITA